jgi:hypothetical protein
MDSSKLLLWGWDGDTWVVPDQNTRFWVIFQGRKRSLSEGKWERRGKTPALRLRKPLNSLRYRGLGE